jgi:hypothetical protein
MALDFSPQRLVFLLSQLEGVELFRRRSEVPELVCGRSRGRKCESRKRRSEQSVQIVNRADTVRDVWTVMLSSMPGKRCRQ